MTQMKPLGTSLLLATALLSSPAQVEACSAEICDIRVVPANGSSVPSNLPGVLVGDLTYQPLDSILFTAGEALPAPLERLIALRSTPNSGDTLKFTLSARVLEDCPDVPVSIDLTPATDFPSALGTLTLSPPELTEDWVSESSGGCFSRFPVMRTMATLELHSSAKPWAEALWLELLVDGKPWRHTVPNAVWLEAPEYAHFRPTPALDGEPLLILCANRPTHSSSTGISEGKHTIQYAGYLADGQHWETDIQTFSLYCPDPAVNLDAGIEMVDSGPLDAAEKNEPTNETSANRGCTVSGTNGASTVAPFWALLSTAGLVLLGRRRRQTRNAQCGD